MTGHGNYKARATGVRRGCGFKIDRDTGIIIPALSFTPCWCWSILACGKPIENRSRPTRYTGPVWMHAAQTMTRAEYERCAAISLLNVSSKKPDLDAPEFDEVVRCNFVGLTWITGCRVNPDQLPADASDERREQFRWEFQGQFGWTLDRKRTMDLFRVIAAPGARGLWAPTLDEQIKLYEQLPSSGKEAIEKWRAECKASSPRQ